MKSILGSKIIQNATNPTTSPQLDFPLSICSPWTPQIAKLLATPPTPFPLFLLHTMDSTNRKTPYHSHRFDTLLQSLFPQPPKSQNKLCIYIQVHTILTHTTQTNFQTGKQASKQTSSLWQSEGLCPLVASSNYSNNQNSKCSMKFPQGKERTQK